MTAEEHYKYSASQISRIVRCPGSVDFVQYLISKSIIPKDETSEYATEGTMLHKQQEKAILGLQIAKDLTAEQEECIDANTQWFKGVCETHGIFEFWCELKANLEGFDVPNTGGTTDVAGMGVNNGKTGLHIFDWKFGRGVFVECKKNEQMMTYLLTQIKSMSGFDDFDEFWIHIGQPRLNNFDSYQCTKEELIGLLNAIKNAQKSHDIHAGQKQCLWCRGKVNCAEYTGYAASKAADIFALNHAMSQNQIDFKEMSRILKFEPLFKKVFKAIKDHMATLSSDQLADLKLKRVAGRSFRTFTDKKAVVEYLIEEYGLDDIYEEPTLKSPSQLEQTVKGLKKDSKFQSYITKPIGAATIVDITDKRPDYDAIGAEGVFAYLKK